MVENIQENIKDIEKNFEIIGDDFKLIFDGRIAFDLFFKNKKNEWKLEGYNINLFNCMRRIMYFRLNKKIDTTDLKTFFQEMKKMKTEIQTLLEEITGNAY